MTVASAPRMRGCYVIAEARAIADLMSVEGHALTAVPGATWEINRINVPIEFRGQGYGRQLLLLILADADAAGVALTLTPVASGSCWRQTPRGAWVWRGLKQRALEAWYMRYGFRWANARRHTHMVRLPGAPIPEPGR